MATLGWMVGLTVLGAGVLALGGGAGLVAYLIVLAVVAVSMLYRVDTTTVQELRVRSREQEDVTRH